MRSSDGCHAIARRDWMQLGMGFLIGSGTAGLTGCELGPNQKPSEAPVSEASVSEASASPSRSKRDWQPSPFRKMVALGESTTAGGWSTSPDRCWVPLLAALVNDFQETPMEYVNSGIGANVISKQSPGYDHSGKPAALERLDRHVVAHNPDLLIVSYGLNDARGATPLPLFREELLRVLREVRASLQPLIVLLSPYYMTASAFKDHAPHWNHATLEVFRQFGRATAEVAAAEDCLYVDVLAANGETDWMVHYDGVHQNDLGHRIVANRVFEVLAQNCSGLARKTKEAEKRSPRWRDESMLRADYGY